MNEESKLPNAKDVSESVLRVFTAPSEESVRSPERAAGKSAPYVRIERAGAAEAASGAAVAQNDAASGSGETARGSSETARGAAVDERDLSLTAAGWERVCSANVPPIRGSGSPGELTPESPLCGEATEIECKATELECKPTMREDTLCADRSAADLTPAADRADRRGGRRRRAAVAAILTAASVAAFVCAGAFVADAISQFGKAALYSGFAAAPAETQSETASEGSNEADAVQAETEKAELTVPSDDAEESESFPIEHISMAAGDPYEISNMTDYVPDVAALTSVAAFAAAAPTASDGPAVLVIHTHSTEAYAAPGMSEYSEQVSFRSADTEESVVAVGRELCAGLGEAGIEAIHCTRLLDTEDFDHAYDRAAEAVREYLEKYPSIRLVLDVHRDAIFRPDGTLIAPTTADGAAQVMIVCGTDELGADFPDWRDNLSFAFAVQAAAKARFGDLMRGVNLRGASFNEQLAERYLLVEVGSAGNTLDEAKAGARRFAEALAAAMGQ